MRIAHVLASKDFAFTPKRVGTFYLAILFAWLLCATPTNIAFADELNTLNDRTTGSIDITITDDNGVRVGGGVLTAYKIANLNTDNMTTSYTYTDEFKQCPIDISEVTANLSSPELPTIAADLTDYARTTNIIGQVMTIGIGGEARLVDASLGLYLIEQTQPADGYRAISPFLVTIPFNDRGTWIYDINAEPKIEYAKALTQDEIQHTASSPSASGTKLAQTGDDFSQWIARCWPWLALICAAGMGTIIIIALYRRKHLSQE